MAKALRRIHSRPGRSVTGYLFFLPVQTVEDATGVPIPGALLYFYASGTNNALNTYADAGLTTPNPNPVPANQFGAFPPIYLGLAAYKVILTDASNNQIWSADPVQTSLQLPPISTRQVLIAGTGATYVTPAGARQLRVRMVGGGGGGGGGGSSGGGNGGVGGDTIFGGIHAAGGNGGGGNTVPGNGGTGGTGAASFRGPGNCGGNGEQYSSVGVNGGEGGGSLLGGGTNESSPSIANSGAGGSGSGINAAGNSGGGAGAGEYVELIINNPAATYTYTIGAGGTAGTAGSSGGAGNAGGTGVIIVDEFY